MKKNNRLFHRKNTFSSLLMLFLSLNSSLLAQIIYTDIQDITPNVSYSLDLNNDGVVDFGIHHALLDQVVCTPQNNNAYSGQFVSGEHLPWAFGSTTTICDSLATWFDANHPGTLALGTNAGNWVGATDKYLALKLVVGANTYFGWLRIDILGASTSFKVKDYAFESTPNSCIQTGQTSLGFTENSEGNSFSIYPNPFISSTTLKINGKLNNINLTVYNSIGQIVNQKTNIAQETLSLSRDNLPKGIYFLEISDENKVIGVEKLMIMD